MIVFFLDEQEKVIRNYNMDTVPRKGEMVNLGNGQYWFVKRIMYQITDDAMTDGASVYLTKKEIYP